MNKLMIIVVCGLMATQTVLFAQQAQDPQLQANAANPIVQAELDEPDGVAITLKPDGTFQIFARGTGAYDFNDSDDIKDARRDAMMRAKANLSKFLKEKITSAESLEEVSRKAKSMTSDGQVQKVAVSKESVKVATESIYNASEAILTGVITLKDQKVPRGNGGEIQVTVGISSKTLKVARTASKEINKNLQGCDEGASAPVAPIVVPKPNNPVTRTANTDF